MDKKNIDATEKKLDINFSNVGLTASGRPEAQPLPYCTSQHSAVVYPAITQQQNVSTQQPNRIEQIPMQQSPYEGNHYLSQPIQIQRSSNNSSVNVIDIVTGVFTVLFGVAVLGLSIYTVARLNLTTSSIWGGFVIMASGVIAIVSACYPKNKQYAVYDLVFIVLGTAVTFGFTISYPFYIDRVSDCRKAWLIEDFRRVNCKTARTIYGLLVGVNGAQLILYIIAGTIKCIRSYLRQNDQMQNTSYPRVPTPTVFINVPTGIERNVPFGM